MAGKFYWLKERHNPQFNKPYWVACGQITAKEAKSMENPIYGYNFMHKFTTKEEYEKKIGELKKQKLMLDSGI